MTAAIQELSWRRPPGVVRIVLPAFNEEQSIGTLLERIDEVMHDDQQQYQVILVDDGSSDRTAEIAEKYAKLLPIRLERHEKNKGLGATIRDGLSVAASLCGPKDVVVAMDADNTHTPALILRMLRAIEEGNDVVIASRYQRGSYIRGLSWPRRSLSFGARILFQCAFPINGVRDYTSGFRAYRGDVLKRAFDEFGTRFIDQDGFQCMVDILLKLRQHDVICSEVPLILRYDLKGGASKMRVLKTIRATLALLIKRRLGLHSTTKS